MAGPPAGYPRSASGAARLSGEENFLSVASTVVAVLPVSLTGAVAVSLRHGLGRSLGELGIGIGSYYATSAFFSAALSSLVQRFGPRNAIRLGLFAGTLSMAGIGSLAESMTGFLVFLIAGGLSNAIIHPAVNHFLTMRMERGRLALAVATKQAAVPVALLLSGVSVPLLALNFGWRSVFLFGAVIAVAPSVAWTLQRRTQPPAPGSHRNGRVTSTQPTLAILAIVGGLAAMGGNAIGVFLVSSAVAIDFSQGQAALLLAAGSAACALVRLGAGLVADRRSSGGMRPFAVLLAVGGLGYLGLSSQAIPVFAAAAIIAFGGGWGWPGLFQFAVIAANPGVPATATGITQTGVYLGAAAGPLLFGALATSSYALAWTTMSGLSLAASVLGLVIARAR